VRRRKTLARGKKLKRALAPMKRTELKRGGKPLKRTPLKRTSALKASRVVWGRVEAEAHRAWVRKITRRPCAVCAAESVEKAQASLHGRRDAHHVLPARYIRRYVRSLRLPAEEAFKLLVSLLYDPRNGICLCRRCHDKHETGFRRVPRALIPTKAVQFAREIGLDWYIDKTYP
jgi:hypothetical protein